ncbi:MAG: ABC transporter permease [Gammaproteobacteria bacterium]|nr:ABC transporter permease [Gammaproteobacteria bacterium]
MIARGWRGHVRYFGFRAYCAALLVALMVPLLLVFLVGLSGEPYLVFPPHRISLSQFAPLIESPEWRAALGNSVLVAVVAAVIATIAGTLAAIGLARTRIRGWKLLLTVLLAPLAVPSIVWALGLHFIFRGIGMKETYAGIILAHAVLTAPIVFVAVSANLRDVSQTYLQAALSLGAEPVLAFRTITLPLIVPGIAGGALIAFIISFGDLVLALFLGGSELRTLPVIMFEGAQIKVDSSLAAVATVLTLIAIAVTVAVQALRRIVDRIVR